MMTLSFKTLFLIFALLCFSVKPHFDGHSCNHDEIEQNPGYLDIEEDTSSLQQGEEGRLLSSSYPNIRIFPYFKFLEDNSPSSYAAYLKNELVPPIIDYFQAALKVKYPVVGNLKLGSSVKTICDYDTPSILKDEGVPADMFVYFDSHSEDSYNIALSKYCYLASGTKRPLVARTLVNRKMMPIANGDLLVHERNMYTLLHEMIHNFGFSYYNYNSFVDDNGNTRTGHIKSVKVAGSTRTVLDLPPLTDRLRKFFGCSSLQGAIMENSGGSTTSSSHFERQFFIYETMSSGAILGGKISEFSLALLEGSGWYIPNYDYAEHYFFGKGQGCDFINSKCSSSSQFDEFCTGNIRGCTSSGRGGGYCSSDSIADGCKFYYPSDDYNCENPDAVDNARLPDLQVFGRESGSKCFSGTLNTRQSSSGGGTSFCFKYTCSGSGSSTELEVQVGSNKITCTEEGTKTIDGYYGAVNCPDPLTFCSTVGKKTCPLNCAGRGTCVNGKCQCKPGYSGIDCTLNN